MKRTNALSYAAISTSIDSNLIVRIAITFTLLMTIFIVTAFAQPANDDCAAAITIGCGEALSGTTTGANADAVGLCGTSATAPGVFYAFTGTGDEITVSLCANTNYDSKLSVFEGDCSTLLCVDGNDDFCTPYSQVIFNSVLGTNYIFYVHGFNAATGDFEIAVTCDDGSSGGDNCSAPGSTISDALPTTTDTISIATGLSDVITDLNVSVDISHTYISDLTIMLQSPSGIGIILFDGSCGSADDMDALFDDGAGSISCPPFGTFSPAQALAAFVGENPDGDWILSITDNFAGDDGTLNEWCLIPTLGPPINVPNDHCGDAVAIACGETLNGSTLGADVDTIAATCNVVSVTSSGVWYKLIGDGSIVTASTCGAASFDSKLSVYTDGCGILTCVTGNDDVAQCAGSTSELSFATTAGVEYLILVHGFGGAAGDFSLTISCQPTSTNDECADAIAVTCNQLVSGSTVGTTADNADTCGTNNTSPGVWYSFTGTGDYITVSTCGAASFDTKISVFTGSCGALACVGGNDDFTGCIGFTSQFGFLSVAGTEYLILIHGYEAQVGSFDMTLSCTPITIANDFCTGALPISCGDVVTGSTTDATPEGETPCIVSNTASGVWFKFMGDGSLVTASTCNANNLYDTKISVYEGTCGSLTCVNANDDDGRCVIDPFFSTVSWIAVSGTDYFILVHGFGSETGDFELSLTCAIPLANDNCGDVAATPITTGAPVTFTGTTAGATQNGFEASEFGFNIVWESFTLTGECSQVTISYCGSTSPTFNIFASLYTECASGSFLTDSDGAPDAAGCPDSNLTYFFIDVPAGTYHIPVFADAAFLDPLGDYSVTVSVQDCPPVPVNDDVCNASPLTLGTPTAFYNFSSSAQEFEPTPGVGTAAGSTCNSQDGWCALDPGVQASVWFYFTAPASGHVAITAEGFDAQLAAYTVGNCADFSTFAEEGANDDSNPACEFCPRVDLTCLTPGQTYYVQLDGFSGALGSGTITVTDAGLADIITGYTIVDANTDTDIAPLLDGDILNKRLLPPFSIRADVCTPVGSVQFHLNGNFYRTENVVPFALAGDAPTGNYRAWNGAIGIYDLQAIPFANRNATGGQAGFADNISFTVVDENCLPLVVEIQADNFGEETSFELADLSTGTIVGTLDAGTLGAFTSYRKSFCIHPDHCYEFRIFDAFGDGICCDWGNGSYKVTFNGTVVAAGGAFTDTEVTPFGNCTPDCADVPGGEAVTDANGACCQESELDCSGICFGGNTAGLAITSFTLVHAQTDSDLGELNDGDVLDLSLIGQINVRANPCSSAGSVRFKLNGNNYRVENYAPFALAGDAPTGNYNKWNVAPGTYTIEAIPYSGANGSGTAGNSRSVTITIVGNAKAEEGFTATIEGAETLISSFPNPFSEELTFEFSLPADSDVALEIYTISGARIATVFEGNVKGSVVNQKTFSAGDLTGGLYLYKLTTANEVLTGKVTLVR